MYIYIYTHNTYNVYAGRCAWLARRDELALVKLI